MLLELKLKDFKGYREAGFKFQGKTVISGPNGCGKSTILDAHLWLFANCDSSLKDNPDIRPDDGRECIPRVEETWELENGTTVTVAKMQKKTASKPKDGSQPKISLTNSYEINGVPKTERDFKMDLESRGVNLGRFLPLSHVDAFISQKRNDMRKELFGMASALSDYDVALQTEGCGEAAELLSTYRMDEVSAMNKASMKKAEEQCKAIPNQIIGLEEAKADIDVAEQELLKASLLREIGDLKKEIAGLEDSGSIKRALETEIARLSTRQKNLAREAEASLNEQRNDWKGRIEAKKAEKDRLGIQLSLFQSQLEVLDRRIKLCMEELTSARDEYNQLSKRQYDDSLLRQIGKEKLDESAFVCPTCGQELPQGKKQEIINGFEESKRKRIEGEEKKKMQFKIDLDLAYEDCIHKGNQASSEQKKLMEDRAAKEKDIETLKQEILRKEDCIAQLEADGSGIPQAVDLSQNEEYMSLGKAIAEKQEKLDLISESGDCSYRKEKEVELKEKGAQLYACEAEIARYENNIRIDGKIDALQKSLLAYEQKKADCQRILDMLDKVSRRKNELLTDEINSHFEGVRWKLFDYRKNSEYMEVCVPEFWDAGKEEWHSIYSSNAALASIGKINILLGLQRFYKVSYPIFVDAAESLDSHSTAQIQMDRQVIFLKVTDNVMPSAAVNVAEEQAAGYKN